jgi:hypothetical protein
MTAIKPATRQRIRKIFALTYFFIKIRCMFRYISFTELLAACANVLLAPRASDIPPLQSVAWFKIHGPFSLHWLKHVSI